MEATQAYERTEVDHRRDVEWYAARAQADTAASSVAAVTPAVPAVEVRPTARRISIKDISDPGRTDEVPVIEFEEMDGMRAQYKLMTTSK